MIKDFESNFGAETPGWITWRLSFDGKHYFASIADRTTNGDVSVRKFLEDIVTGKAASLSFDDEGDFFNIDVEPLPEQGPKNVKVKLQEARGGRSAEVVVSASDFVNKVDGSIKAFLGDFKDTPFLDYSVLENYGKE